MSSDGLQEMEPKTVMALGLALILAWVAVEVSRFWCNKRRIAGQRVREELALCVEAADE